MKGKILFIAGLGVGYVLGTKAGRERYEQIAAVAGRFWGSPLVQKQVDTVEGFVRDKAPDVAEFAGETVKKVVGAATGRSTASKRSAAAKKAAATRRANAARSQSDD
jgi:hypothetical protein